MSAIRRWRPHPPAGEPTLSMDFLTGWTDALATIAKWGVFARVGNTGTRFNSSGVLEIINQNIPRQDFHPITLAVRGLLVEAGRTNSIRNGTAAGNATGSPGTAPSNWTVTTGGGVTRTIVAAGIENGYEYIDVRFQTAGAVDAIVQFDTTTQIAAAQAQIWSQAVSARIIAGGLTGVGAVDLNIRENDGAGAQLAIGSTPVALTSIMQRFSHVRSLTNAGTAFVIGHLRVSFSGAGDITLRLAMPQLEQGFGATSWIRTNGAAAVRSGDVAQLTALDKWFRPDEGTLVVEFEPANLEANDKFIASIDDGTINERMYLLQNTAQVRARILDGGVGFNPLPIGALALGTPAKAALSYKQGDSAAATQGLVMPTWAPAGLPTVTRLRIGCDYLQSTQLNGWIRRLSYRTQRRPASRLQIFTT